MEIEIIVAVLILFALVFLATIDMAFIQLSDVSLRRLSTETEEKHYRTYSSGGEYAVRIELQAGRCTTIHVWKNN